MPLPTSIKPKHVVWVVWTLLGPHYVSEDREQAKAYKKMLEQSGHKVTVRKYHAGKTEEPVAD